jgi:hypothetical protein
MFLTEAEIHIARRQYARAMEALRRGIALLASLDDPRSAEVRAALERLRDRFADRVDQEASLRAVERGNELVERAEREIDSARYGSARNLLETAAGIWPRRHFPDGGREIDRRLERARTLVAEAASELGEARAFLLARVPFLDPDGLDRSILHRLETALEVVADRGLLDLSVVYSDLDLLAHAARGLDTLSERIADRANRAKEQYEAGRDVEERQRLYEIHRHFLDLGHEVDALISSIPLDPGEGR